MISGWTIVEGDPTSLQEGERAMGTVGRFTLGIILLGSVAAFGCGGERPQSPPTVDITAEDYEFTAPDTVSSGWTTLRMHNQGSEQHLFALVRLPDRVTYHDFKTQVVAPYDSVWSLVVDGRIDRAEARRRLRPLLPDWYPDEATLRSGVGLTAPGRTAETTVDLEPGTYVVECYAMTSEEQYHAFRGMIHPLTVTPASSDATPPAADQTLTVADLDLRGAGPVSPGEHTFAVRFEKDPKALPVQHLHLARLDEDTGADELAEWMTSLDPVMPAGETAYVTVDLHSGRYAWLLGVPPEQGELETFTVE